MQDIPAAAPSTKELRPGWLDRSPERFLGLGAGLLGLSFTGTVL